MPCLCAASFKEKGFGVESNAPLAAEFTCAPPGRGYALGPGLLCHLPGVRPRRTRQPPTEAVQWYTRAARQGDNAGAFAPGRLLRAGHRTPQSWGMPSAGTAWPPQELPGIVESGPCYERGAGVRCNPEEALHLYRRAARLACLPPRTASVLYERGDGVSRAGPTATAHYRRAAEAKLRPPPSATLAGVTSTARACRRI